MIQMMSKTCSEPMTVMKTQILIVGPSSGSVTRRVVCQGDAPSMAAASFSSAGMPCSPASSKMMPKPMYCQVSTTKMVYSTTWRLASHSCTSPPSPTDLHHLSTKPPGCSNSDHMTAVTAGGSTYGAKITSRMNVRPRNLRFSSSAIPRLIGPWITSASPVEDQGVLDGRNDAGR